jgi:hypothetical protein
MPEYEFRLRFNLASTRINANVPELPLLDLPGGVQLRLRSGQTKKAIQDLERLAVVGSPFRSVEEARAAGEKTKSVLLYWALDHKLGIDFGDGHPRSRITPEGFAQLERDLNSPVRADVHGLDVYERNPELKFVLVQATAQLGVNVDSFIATFVREFEGARKISAKQSLAAEIYSSSFFDVSPKSRFITLVSAVEALLDPDPRPESVQLLVREMEQLVRASEIDKPTADSIYGSLQWLKAESIGQAGRKLAARLLSSKQYENKPADKFFNESYVIRSSLVHRGFIQPSINPLTLANTMSEFVGDLLLASLNENREIESMAN